MADDSFQLAARRARQAYSADEWINLEPREQADAIYRELRRIDASRAGERPDRRAPVDRVAEPATAEAT